VSVSGFAAQPNLARLDVRTTLSKKFNDRNRRPMSNAIASIANIAAMP